MASLFLKIILIFALLGCSISVFGQSVNIGSSSSHLTESEMNETIHALTNEIHNKVASNWLRPNMVTNGLTCTIQVKMLPSGEIVDSAIVKGSGYVDFDQSALQAVSKSSPLPKIPHKDLYPVFMQFLFLFKPD